MSALARGVAVALLVAGGGLAGCGGGDDDAESATTVPATVTTSGARTLTVCGVEEQADGIDDGSSAAGDFESQRATAVAYLDELIALRARGRAPAEIAADYASVTEAYEVVRDAFEASTTPEGYLAEVERLARAAFGTPEEVDRFEAAYSAWVERECGFDPALGIELFAAP